jgi:Putative esterase
MNLIKASLFSITIILSSCAAGEWFEKSESNPKSEFCISVDSTHTSYENYGLLLACLRDEDEPGDLKENAISQFIEIVEENGGFPIIENSQVVFVYIKSDLYDIEDDKNSSEDFSTGNRMEPIRISGDFNNWNEETALTSEGFNFYHTELTVDTTLKEKYGYKFISKNEFNENIWFADPLSKRFDFDEFGKISFIIGGKNTQGIDTGHLEWIKNVHATQLLNNRHIYIYVPRNYDYNPTKRYPVIYMHDGNNLFSTFQPNSNGTWDADGVANLEIDNGFTKEFIIVGIPNNAQRMEEYTHIEDDINGTVMGGDGDEYGDFIVNDLKPLIDSKYRTLSDKENTAILGSSLGGLISYYIGIKHPDTFKYIGGMSSTFAWGSFGLTNPTMENIYNDDSLLSSYAHIYYLDSGDNPLNGVNPPVCPLGDSEAEDNYCETMNFKTMLETKGINIFPDNADLFPLTPANINIYHYYEPDAAHNEDAWNQRLYRPLRLFFRP